MTSPRWARSFNAAAEEVNKTMREERETIERLKAQIGLLLDGQSRYVVQIVLQHHLRRIDMVGVHTTSQDAYLAMKNSIIANIGEKGD